MAGTARIKAMRIVICPICKKEIESRSDFAYMTLNNHLKTHKNVT